MGRWKLAYRILFDGQLASRVNELLDAKAPPEQEPVKPRKEPAPAIAPKRSDAISLLATLQREGRLVDFLMESFDGYSDAQVGAAARDVQRDSRSALDRLLALRPVADQPEGTTMELSGDPDPGRLRLTGHVTQDGPKKGKLVHHGWEATRCELPTWTGSEASACVLAPAEVDVSHTA